MEFLSLSEFRVEKPSLSQDLEDGHAFVTDEHYAYRLSGFYVERVWIETYKSIGKKAFHIPREHFDHKQDPWQQKLGSRELNSKL